ncbi:hypothetical protein [Malacoplasma iowae]|uniref:Uncharacterized protein n=1 Tax=Malacoplasma iowae DK-CPA TaxID=1394179 RepID=A0A084U453_MALIO|nr:hypothetical protein [Malacoplasma iowae]KFB07739.1 hypothetical protein P271_596 [Malacoplasma iowae DK-CPA]WPL37250.1 hypothetical protein QX179_02075 [Malacoplasma iowae]WPL37633.1 hypothetical protein QX182_03990 [Malacoplasma iowae]WPL40811.1 hypothetical protein QX184_04740 [Malacoplasma iowae]
MAKRKYSFTDLSDDIVVQKPIQQEEKPIKNDQNNTNSNSETKNDNISENIEKNPQNPINNEIKEEKYVSKYDIDINYDDDEPVKNNTSSNNVDTSKNNEVENKTFANDDQNKSNINIAEKNETSKPIFNERPVEERNSKTVIRTFNESLNYQTNNENKKNELSNNSKANELFSSKEKLDVKTNIYLKPKLVFKIKELVDRTGESRSSVINKLIEFALEEMEK